MKVYKNSNGCLIDCNGQPLKSGDVVKVHLSGFSYLMHIYYDGDGILCAKGSGTCAYAETICKGAEKVEIVNR